MSKEYEAFMDSQSLLDEMVSEDSVQLLKAALPYIPSSRQPAVSVFAKFLELQNTIRLFHTAPGTMQICGSDQVKSSPLEMLSACSKVCHGPVKEQIDSMINAFAMMQMLELSQQPPVSSCESRQETEVSHE